MFRIISGLETQKTFRFKSQGVSMLPTLQPDDIIYSQKISFRQCSINDLILGNNKHNFIHRVIYKSENYIITKGDNNLHSDGRIFPHQILGKVYQVKRNGQIFRPDDIYLLQSTQYFQEIVRIKKAFEKEEIDHVFLKGLPLHLYIEKSHPKRTYADFDLMMNKHDWQKAEKIIIKFGYKELNNTLSPIHKRLKRTVNELNYFKYINKFPVVLDFHFESFVFISQFDHLSQLYPEEFIHCLTRNYLKDIRTVKFNGECFPFLSPANSIFFLSLHYFSHNLRGAYRLDLLDKVVRIESTEMILNNVKDNILKFKLQNFVYPVFLLLKKYYHTPLPEKFMESIEPDNGKMKYIKDNILNINIFNDETRIQAGVSRFRNLFFLSPNPLWRRLMIVFNIQVIYSFFWVIIFFARRSFRRSLKSISALFSLIP